MDIFNIEEARVRRRAATGSLLLLTALSGCAGGTNPRPPRALIARSLEAMGIPAEPSAEEGLLVDARGILNQGVENQGRFPGSLDPNAFHETLAVDVHGERLAYEYRHERIDGSSEWIRDLYEGRERTIAVRSEDFAIRLVSPDFARERESLWRRFPHLLLREALSPSARLRTVTSNGEHENVGLDLESGETLVLSFDQVTTLLSRVAYVTDVQSFGDTEVVWTFRDYAAVEGFGLLPRRYGITVAGRPYTEMDVTRASTDSREWRALFSLPEGMQEPDTRTLPDDEDASANARVETVAPGVHVVRNLRVGFHPMFVELSDSIVALDAPAGFRLLTHLPAGDVAAGASSAWLSERYLELIEEAVPQKPVRYVVLTHFHNDHAGGLRAFVARGATVIGPSSIEEAVERLVTAPHTVAPDALSTNPRALRFEGVDDVRALGDDEHRIELIDIGPNPHSDAMLVIHVPEHDILFTSDLVELDGFLANWLDARGLRPDRVFAMHRPEPTAPRPTEENP